MRKVMNNLMACLLLLQAAFGICCHDAEACAACRETTSRIQVRVACCERCAPPTSDEAPPCCPTDERAACHGFCTYVKADTVNLELCGNAAFALATPSLDAGQSNVTVVVPRHLAEAIAPSHALRLHALYQVILI